MSHIIAAIDAGNGGVNALVRKSSRTTNSVYFPSARAAATGDRLGVKDEIAFKVVEWGQRRYVFGEEALQVRTGVESHVGSNRYGNEFHAFLVATALAECKVTTQDIDLMLLCPPGYYADRSKQIANYFNLNGGKVTMQFMDDKRPRSWTYRHVGVLPEGLAAALCLGLDSKGNLLDTDALDGDLVILDGGMFTLDAVELIDGIFNPETLQYSTNDRAGIKAQILLPVLRELRKQYDDCAMLEVEHVDKVLRQGVELGDWTLEIGQLRGSQAIDTKPLFDHFVHSLAGYVANRIIDDSFDGLRGYKGALLVGGWADLVEPHLVKWYGDKIMTVNTVPQLAGMHPIDLNAHGALRYRLAERAYMEAQE